MKYEFQVRMQQRHLKAIVVAPALRTTICFARGFLSRNHAHSRGRFRQFRELCDNCSKL